MKVKLAGFNVDADSIRNVKELAYPNPCLDLTPEVISAAYARISRDPAPIDELRAKAREEVNLARESNQEIIFGMGHASIAEHSVFNFDITDVSRLAIESIEHHRLCSYTEKSQRYTKIDKDAVISTPSEIRSMGLEDEFQSLMKYQADIYSKIYVGLIDYLAKKYHEKKKHEIRGMAQEDSRYATSLSIPGQLGMTCNGRNLEYMIQQLSWNTLHEVWEISKQLHQEVADLAPSIIRNYTSSSKTECYFTTIPKLEHFKHVYAVAECITDFDLRYPVSPDEDRVLAAMLFQYYPDNNWVECLKYVSKLYPDQKTDIAKTFLSYIDRWSAVPRAFELTSLAFELTISASCFAQLKRHRMATLLPQEYNPALRYTIPPNILEAGLEGQLEESILASNSLYEKIYKQYPHAAQYVLTQAHKRRVLFHLNLRELYAFARLRQDNHAQWDIRDIANKIVEQAKYHYPILTKLICGKDVFNDVRGKLYDT